MSTGMLDAPFKNLRINLKRRFLKLNSILRDSALGALLLLTRFTTIRLLELSVNLIHWPDGWCANAAREKQIKAHLPTD